MPNESLNDRLREILVSVLSNKGIPESAVLLEQARTATVQGGPITMLDLSTAKDVPRTQQAHRPWPVRVDVLGTSGDVTGGLLLWVEEGRLASLEYFWYTDEPPSQLPSVAELQVRVEYVSNACS